MNDFDPAKKLRNHRALLLSIEAIGWIHMAGKAKSDFLRRKGGHSNNYSYERWFENELFPWSDLLDWVRIRYPLDSNAWPSTMDDFLIMHKKSNPGILGLLQAGHGLASGIEKNMTPGATDYLKQDITHMWLSSAFGYPVRNLLSDSTNVVTDSDWKRLVEQIRIILEELKNLGTNSNEPENTDWCKWRENAIGKNGILRQTFASTVAETRLPNNDVSLWDQSYVAAALFKSAMAGAILDESFNWADKDIKKKTRWRLLTVGIGTNHYESRAVKIGDWKGAHQSIEKFFSKFQVLVEVDLACGSLLYKDTEVAVFSFLGGEEGRVCDSLSQWEEYFRIKANEIAEMLELETPPYCRISEPSRSLILLTRESRTARKTLEIPIHQNWKIPINNFIPNQGHVCPVCFVRFSEKYAEKQKPCTVCNQRRHNRLNSWIDEADRESDTIWIDEIADYNNRVALLTISLDIEPWLDGTRIDSLRSQSIDEWQRYNSVLKKDKSRNDLTHHALTKEILKSIKRAEKKSWKIEQSDSLLRSLQEGYKNESDWHDFFAKIVEDRADAPSFRELDLDKSADWLVHQFFRKLASPGRVYRFWRQTNEFFSARYQDFREICSNDPTRWRVRRLILKPDATSSLCVNNNEIYSGRWRNSPLELLYHNGEFCTICNLARLFGPEESKDMLKNEELMLRDENGNEILLKIEAVKDNLGSLGIYHPIIPLEISPIRFRVIIPLAATSECVNKTITAWEEQFGRVWDRLPIRIGVVVFPRMIPFQAVIESARNIEDELRKKSDNYEIWSLSDSSVSNSIAALRFIREDNNEETRFIPVRIPDGRDDVFYPYLSVEDPSIRFTRDFQHPNGQVYRHAKDLSVGDRVKVSPSVIATVFLETTAARFDPIRIHYLDDWRIMNDVWDTIINAAPSQTAIISFWSDLEACRENWLNPNGCWPDKGEQVWIDLARAMLSNRLMARGSSLDALTESARTGILEWSLKWHLRVLKENLGGKL